MGLLLIGLAALASTLEAAPINDVRSVYLLPMANGLDQYLAQRITETGVFQVVTDAKRADAVLTDRLGEAFEQRLTDLYPPPKVDEAQTKPEKEEEGAGAKDAADKAKEGAGAGSSGDIISAGAVRGTSFSRGKGNIFLVDVKSRAVLWSVYQRPKNSTPDELSRTASRVVEHLKKRSSKQ